MKRCVFLLAVLLTIGSGVVLLPFGCARSSSEQTALTAAKYICPMHPSVVSDRPGDCSICGMRLVPVKGTKSATSGSGVKPAVKPATFHCPMHPEIVSDKEGDCPICGMKLVLIKTGEATAGGTSSVPGLVALSIPDDARRRMGLTLGTVEKKEMSRSIRTSARIVVDETRLFRVMAKAEGWVDKLYVSVSGQAVSKGDPLLSIYSPQLVSAQQEYLSTFQAAGSSASNSAGTADMGFKVLLDSARQRLQFWDVSVEDIARLERTGRVEKTLTLYTPASGFVTEKGVMAGQKIMPGESLMVIADLSVVWGEADIYESDLPFVQVGIPISISLPYWPDKTFSGKVSFISPSLDPETRTLKIRLEIPNSESLLKLEMYADARLSYPLGTRLVAPEGAIMRTGERIYAFRDDGDGLLVPVEVKIGVRNGGYYEILSGLNDGDRVVTSANFLVDSESSMRAALEAVSKNSQ